MSNEINMLHYKLIEKTHDICAAEHEILMISWDNIICQLHGNNIVVNVEQERSSFIVADSSWVLTKH